MAKAKRIHSEVVWSREIQHTLAHIDCPACSITRDALMRSATVSPEYGFEQGAVAWLEGHSLYIQESTRRDYKHYIKALTKFFGEMKLSKIEPANIVEYQKWRKAFAGNQRVNHECNTLSQILSAANLWEEIKPYYKPFPVSPSDTPGRALSPEQRRKLFQVARDNPRWEVAYLASLISVNTAAGPGEIRHLRLGDMDLARGEFGYIYIIQGVKNQYRKRDIPLNRVSGWAVRRALERAKELGAELPQHYLFPARGQTNGDAHGHRERTHDVTRPITSWKKAWYALTIAAGLKGLRRYDLRHTGLTELLENPENSEETVRAIAGHVSKRILERYSHIRSAKKVSAVKGLEKADEIRESA